MYWLFISCQRRGCATLLSYINFTCISSSFLYSYAFCGHFVYISVITPWSSCPPGGVVCQYICNNTLGPPGGAVQHGLHNRPGRLRPCVVVHRSGRSHVHPGIRWLHRSATGKHLAAQICEFELNMLYFSLESSTLSFSYRPT